MMSLGRNQVVRSLHIRYVDGSVDFLCVMVGQKTDIGQCPAINVGDDY